MMIMSIQQIYNTKSARSILNLEEIWYSELDLCSWEEKYPVLLPSNMLL
jgi:hypothetical protein